MAHIPFGYCIEGGHAVIHEEQAARFTEFVRLYLGGISIREAAERAGIEVSYGTARKMLQNPLYAGTDYYPAIISQETLEIVRDGVSSANKSGSTTLVRSTISGLILDIPVKVGNSVTMSNTFNDGTTIATVANMDDLIFDGNIDETEVGRLHVGLPVRISVGALQDVHFDAALEYIAPKATESNGTNLFEIKASVKVPAGITIRSGYSANAEIVLQEAAGVLTVPESAIQWEGDSTFVYVMDGETWNRRLVETGLSDGLIIEVKSGLSEGEKVRGPQIINSK